MRAGTRRTRQLQRGGGLRRFRRWRLPILAATALVSLARGAPAVGAAVIDGAAAIQRGAIVELHFDVRGKGLGWALSTHGDELWVDLEHTHIDLPPRPL